MSAGTQAFLAVSVAIFLLGGAVLRRYAETAQVPTLLAALALYTLGNLMMVRLMREAGMAVAISVSAVLQLVLINLIAISFFGERPRPVQLGGIALGVVAMAMILWPGAMRR